MGTFRRWLAVEALSAGHLNAMRQFGYEYEDEIVVGEMELYLLKADPAVFPEKYRWHLAFQRRGLNVFDISQQMDRDDLKKTHGLGMLDSFRAMEPMVTKIHQWAGEHRQLVIASSNERLTEKWAANLHVASRYFNTPLHVETEEFLGHTLHVVKPG
jgi:hypothetical protein